MVLKIRIGLLVIILFLTPLAGIAMAQQETNECFVPGFHQGVWLFMQLQENDEVHAVARMDKWTWIQKDLGQFTFVPDGPICLTQAQAVEFEEFQALAAMYAEYGYEFNSYLYQYAPWEVFYLVEDEPEVTCANDLNMPGGFYAQEPHLFLTTHNGVEEVALGYNTVREDGMFEIHVVSLGEMVALAKLPGQLSIPCLTDAQLEQLNVALAEIE